MLIGSLSISGQLLGKEHILATLATDDMMTIDGVMDTTLECVNNLFRLRRFLKFVLISKKGFIVENKLDILRTNCRMQFPIARF